MQAILPAARPSLVWRLLHSQNAVQAQYRDHLGNNASPSIILRVGQLTPRPEDVALTSKLYR